MSIQIKELEFFVNSTKFNDKPLMIDECTLVVDRKMFAKSHIEFLLNNSGKKRFKPYYDRLVKFKTLIDHGK